MIELIGRRFLCIWLLHRLTCTYTQNAPNEPLHTQLSHPNPTGDGLRNLVDWRANAGLRWPDCHLPLSIVSAGVSDMLRGPIRAVCQSRQGSWHGFQCGESATNKVLSDGIQQLPCALLLVEAGTQRLQFANLAAFKLFGVDWLPSSQLSQRRVDELFRFAVTDVEKANVDPIGSAAQRREQVVSHRSVLRADGTSKQVLVTSVPLFSDQGTCASVMVSVEDTTEHHRQLQQIQDIAYCDPLTGLPNRLSILQRIQQSFDRTERSHFALLFMDFDRFKLINDSLGHEVGDQLLIAIGKRINQSIRSDDAVSVPARLGGDEFVVLLDHLNDTGVAFQIAERILKAVNEPYHLAGHTIVSTASIGVVTSSHGAESASDMLRKADLAMYKSKTAGKARCSMFDESLKRQVEQRLLLENELRSALKFDEFDFDVQPILNLRTMTEIGGEALLRWQHPRLGRISANQFLEVACETGLIVPVGDQLLRKAGRLASTIANTTPIGDCM